MSAPRVAAVTSPRGWRDFLAVPELVYGRDRCWVPQLDAEVRRTLDPGRNPYFRAARLGLFVAYREDQPVARACAVVNEAHLRRCPGKAGFFGFYESLEDAEASTALLERAAAFCRAAGAQSLEGPFNPNHYSELGLQMDRFESPPAFFETHNPPYYARLLEAAGFGVVQRLHTRANPNVGAYIRGRYGVVPRPAARGEFRVRAVRPWAARRELERIRSVYNDAFAHNWHFLPVSSAEYAFSARYLFLVTRPRLLALVEHRGMAVGVAQCALDVNPLLRRLAGHPGPAGLAGFALGRRHVRDVVFFAVGIKREYQASDVARLLVDYLCWALRDARLLTTTWMTDDNAAALGGAAHFGLEPSKRFAIYGRRL